MTMENPLPPQTPMVDYSASDLGLTETDKDAKMWGMFCHLGSLVGLVVPGGFFIGPLVVWLIKKNDMPFVDDQGKESLNFQLTMLIAFLAAFILVFVFIGILLLPVIGIVDLVFTIIAAIKANDGVRYRYPFAIRFIK